MIYYTRQELPGGKVWAGTDPESWPGPTTANGRPAARRFAAGGIDRSGEAGTGQGLSL